MNFMTFLPSLIVHDFGCPKLESFFNHIMSNFRSITNENNRKKKKMANREDSLFAKCRYFAKTWLPIVTVTGRDKIHVLVVNAGL